MKKIKIGYQGVSGAYSEIAAEKLVRVSGRIINSLKKQDCQYQEQPK
jgi:hypothetical protein